MCVALIGEQTGELLAIAGLQAGHVKLSRTMRATVVIGAYCLLLLLLGLAIEKVDPVWTSWGEVASLTGDALLGWAAVYSVMHLAFGFFADRWWVLALPLLPLLLLWIYYLAFIPLAVLATAAGVGLRRLARSLRRRKRQWV